MNLSDYLRQTREEFVVHPIFLRQRPTFDIFVDKSCRIPVADKPRHAGHTFHKIYHPRFMLTKQFSDPKKGQSGQWSGSSNLEYDATRIPFIQTRRGKKIMFEGYDMMIYSAFNSNEGGQLPGT